MRNLNSSNKIQTRSAVVYEPQRNKITKYLPTFALIFFAAVSGVYSHPTPNEEAPKKSAQEPRKEAPRPMGDTAVAAELTSCTELIHIGDSTSLGLKSKALLPNEEDRVAAKYKAVGIEKFHSEISGARSMVETWEDKPSATQVAKTYRAKDYKGCWFLALGTNDPANVKGDAEMLKERVDAMMKVVGDNPVIWTTTKSLRTKGPYKNANMESWNKVLTEACDRYPNMRIYDWASEVQDDWFSADGLHPNSPGYKERSARFAKALAKAFPKDSTSPAKCIIRVE